MHDVGDEITLLLPCGLGLEFRPLLLCEVAASFLAGEILCCTSAIIQRTSTLENICGHRGFLLVGWSVLAAMRGRCWPESLGLKILLITGAIGVGTILVVECWALEEPTSSLMAVCIPGLSPT